MMSETVKRYWLRLDDIGGHEYMVRASEYDTLATRLAEAEVWLDEVATLCVTAERRVAELEAGQESLILVRDDYKRQAGEYRKKWAELEALQGEQKSVVIPPMVEFDDMVNRLFEIDADAKKYCCRHWLLTLWKATLNRVCELNAVTPPAPEVAGLVEALEAIYDSDPQVPHPASESDVSMGQKMCIYRMRATAKAALAAYTQAKEGEA